jgi:hypothetical protein
MIELAGALGTLFLIGLMSFGVGFFTGLHKTKKWLAKNGCYTCNETFNYKFNLREDDDN